jgi:two-component system NtrC family sensor kinase
MCNTGQNDIDPNAADRVDAFQNELERLRREVDHAHRLATVGTMAAGVAHEVNNLLTPALSYARLAEQSPDDEDLTRKAIAKSVSGIEAASRVLQAILELAQVSCAGESAAVETSLQAAVDCLGRDLDRQGITLDRVIPPGLGVAISPLALQQVLLNLLLNAHRVLGPGGEIMVRARARGDGHTTITVADNGPGVPTSIAGRLFDPFVTSAAPANREPDPDDQRGGSGLGLAVCRRLIESAGGTIELRSAPGEGATFQISLPSAPAEPLVRAG